MKKSDFKRLGDMAAGTLVVYADVVKGDAKRGEARAVAPPWPLAPDEQQTLVNFSERRAQITPERATELAHAAGADPRELSEAELNALLETAYLLRSPAQKRRAWEDLCQVHQLLDDNSS